ncbi:basic helix-loop-helix DNA-binding superfamily protein [Prunus dulcis]|uniref:Basic helix-loop-helix DNA-binding superfamily protein n=1 Tax=Prunus dulcis TaxID=3755 RepID=A0A4Y1QSR7_PRUDU|nr:basic helix-loop-helix DNA-binding superfamily protein [Prunus dulcis]
MRSANLHHQHHQLQENLVGSSSLAATPSCYAVGTKHAWTPSATLSSSGNSSNSGLDPLNSSMVPDLGFHWLTNITSEHQSPHDLAKIKEELTSSSSSDHHPHHHNSFPKLTEMLTSASASTNIDHDQYYQFMKNEEKNQLIMNDLSEKLLLKTLSSGCQINTGEFYSNDHHHHLLHNSNLIGGVPPGMPSRSGGHFSQIYPSINVSNLNRSLSSSSISSSSLDMNLQAMDLLGASARFSTRTSSSFSTQPNSHDTLGLYKETHDSFATLQQMHQSTDPHRLSCGNNNKISSFDNEITEVKRPGSSIEPKVTQATAPKKSRLESRTACPPFKVRKEKLGDRIAALQQLVAPFGKTDTASVLMEAIGYIKFLQNQVERSNNNVETTPHLTNIKTLSVPYMKSSRNKSSKTMQGGVTEINGNGETKRDLRSRGLCLVPLSCMSYVTSDIGEGGSIWPAPNFGGGT